MIAQALGKSIKISEFLLTNVQSNSLFRKEFAPLGYSRSPKPQEIAILELQAGSTEFVMSNKSGELSGFVPVSSLAADVRTY